MEEKITIDDVITFEHLFSVVPAFVLEGMAKKKTNLVKKFQSQVQSHLDSASDEELAKLNIVFNTDIEELQALMDEAYDQTGKKQFKVLANPNYKEFLEINCNELKMMVDGGEAD